MSFCLLFQCLEWWRFNKKRKRKRERKRESREHDWKVSHYALNCSSLFIFSFVRSLVFLHCFVQIFPSYSILFSFYYLLVCRVVLLFVEFVCEKIVFLLFQCYRFFVHFPYFVSSTQFLLYSLLFSLLLSSLHLPSLLYFFFLHSIGSSRIRDIGKRTAVKGERDKDREWEGDNSSIGGDSNVRSTG